MADTSKSSHRNSKTNNPTTTQKESDGASNFRLGRELIESFAIALVLAFMFKSFLAEAYVIPTGSMGVTLMGAHKDVVCTECGYRYSICASEEYERGTAVISKKSRVIGGTCPNCWYTMYFGDEDYDNWINPRYASQPTFTGDRIIVNKSIYDFEPPKRWDVSVFRYPGGPQTNYIKRLIGLENETVRLHNGDVFVRKDGEGETDFNIARKPSEALLSVLQLVHDTEFATPNIHKLGWPLHWAEESNGTTAWTVSDDYKTYFCKPESENSVHWLNYRHIVPSSEDWAALSGGTFPEHPQGNRPRLITDFNAYNAGLSKHSQKEKLEDAAEFLESRQREVDGKMKTELVFKKDPLTMGYNWVGDLCVSGTFHSAAEKGKLKFRMIKGGQEFLCSIDLSDGKATVSVPGFEESLKPATENTPVRGAGTWKIRFANIDEQLRLWVDDNEIDFGDKTVYDMLCGGDDAPLPRNRSPKENDLRPISIGVEGADISISGLKVERDIYYIAFTEHSQEVSGCDLIESPFYDEVIEYGMSYRFSLNESHTAKVLSDPREWGPLGKTKLVEFRMEKDEFLMLGDNSAKSQDGRLWTVDKIPHYVPREAMIGKAIAVYWPHGWPIPGTKLPFVPNFKKMRFIE